jgi:hypothetical protein
MQPAVAITRFVYFMKLSTATSYRNNVNKAIEFESDVSFTVF